MEIIIKVLVSALDNNIAYAVLMDVVIGFLYLFNILLGTIIGAKESKFDIRKFLFGVLKAVCILLIIVGVCYILNVFTLTINLIEGITIDDGLVTTIELLTILITTGIDIAKEVMDKIKAFRELKYISYDNVRVKNDNVIEPTELKG